MALQAVASAYALNFLINFCIPALSPRIYFGEEYTTEIRGLYVGAYFRQFVTKAAAKSFGAFPSGHVGITWLSSIMAARLGFYRYAWANRVAGVLMVCATLYLRYHYFVDVLGALLLIRFGLSMGGFVALKKPRSLDDMRSYVARR